MIRWVKSSSHSSCKREVCKDAISSPAIACTTKLFTICHVSVHALELTSEVLVPHLPSLAKFHQRNEVHWNVFPHRDCLSFCLEVRGLPVNAVDRFERQLCECPDFSRSPDISVGREPFRLRKYHKLRPHVIILVSRPTLLRILKYPVY